VARKIVAVCLMSTIALPILAQRSTPPPPPPQRGAPVPPQGAQPSPVRSPDVIFLPSDDAVVDAMLKMANVRKNDVVYDLGCGDGKIVIAAAKKYGARAVGIDIDPQRIREATANAAAAGVSDRVTFVLGDIFDEAVPIRDATVVTLFLLQRLNKQLRPRLLRELAPGSRVVSNSFDMGEEWPPLRTQHVNNFTIYLWTIPKRAPGF
jgi:SAM-dependent methyltransferase